MHVMADDKPARTNQRQECLEIVQFATGLAQRQTEPDSGKTIRRTDFWPQLPSKYSWQTTHGVMLDRAGNLYVIHEGHVDKPDHPRTIPRSLCLIQPGRFVHPHDACFDADGNIFVAEWVATGRVTKLQRMT